MTWRILNTLDISGAPEASAALNEAGELINKEAIRDDILRSVGKFDAYMVSGKIVIDKEILDAASRLKLIGSPHTGTDHLDLEEIRSRGIELFTITKEIELLEGFTATSELAFGLLMSLVRKLPQAFNASKEGNWAREYFTGFQLRDKTIGILGLGRLGKISAQIANGFGMRVTAYDIRDVNVEGVEMVDFDTLFAQSDVISVHIHLNDETRGLVGARAIASMKPNAIILNTSRGGILDEAALLSALKSDSIGGAGLDVIEGEWLSRDELMKHPLIAYARTHENLLITPHVGGSTTESIYGARVFMARKMAEYIKNSNRNQSEIRST
jgi:D-3-phosphoglycerate dehydrogenase / 2-oxoglutarate reductase